MGYRITELMDNENGSDIDLFSNSQFIIEDVNFYIYETQKTDEGRMDRVAIKIWGDGDLLPELMLLNSFKNCYSLKKGQILYVCKKEDLDIAIGIPEIQSLIKLSTEKNSPTKTRPNSLKNNNINAAVPTAVSDSTLSWLNGESILPPNAPRSNKNNIEIIGGKVVFR